jgi:glucoamylase
MDLAQSPLFSSLTSSSNSSLISTISQPIMYSFASLIVLGCLALQAVFGFPDPSRVKEREAVVLKRSVDSFIATESPIALRDMLCNIGSAGTCVSGAGSGLVIAGPGKSNPDCISPYQNPTFDIRSNICRLLYVDSRLSLNFQVYCRYIYQ